jgi:hypothetical protein
MQNQNTPQEEKLVLPEETIRAVLELGQILRRIHDRRISEGYTFRDGKFYKPDGTLSVPEEYKPYQRRNKK